jgi:hypothetical protein
MRHAWNVITHMFSPSRMARRVSMLALTALQPELARLRCPTLVITARSGSIAWFRYAPRASTRRSGRTPTLSRSIAQATWG